MRTGDVVRLTERCQAGLVGRAGEVEMLSEKCQLGLLSRVGEVERLTKRRLAVVVDRTHEYYQAKDKRSEADPLQPLWNADALPTDEQLKNFVRSYHCCRATFRLMGGIPPDPRIPSANLDFDINKADIITCFLLWTRLLYQDLRSLMELLSWSSSKRTYNNSQRGNAIQCICCSMMGKCTCF